MLVMKAMDGLNVDVILGERLDLASTDDRTHGTRDGRRIVRTARGREIVADLVVCCFPPLTALCALDADGGMFWVAIVHRSSAQYGAVESAVD